MCSILFRLFPIISLFNLIYCFITFLWFLSIEFFVHVAGIFIDENTIFISENTAYLSITHNPFITRADLIRSLSALFIHDP